MSDTEPHVMILRIPLTEREALEAIRAELDIPGTITRRGASCMAAIKESDFMAVANLHQVPPVPPEDLTRAEDKLRGE